MAETQSTTYLSSSINRAKLFCKLYWRTIYIVCTLLLFLTFVLSDKRNKYKCFYVFLITASWWVANILPACIVALLPIVLITIIGIFYPSFVMQMHLSNSTVNCFGIMMFIIAIEQSQVHKRVALKLLIKLGYSHYRLSFILFFITMFLSLWISNTIACGLMMPLVKAILLELEKIGLVEINDSETKPKTSKEKDKLQKPSQFAVFYFLGIAYSSTVGDIATVAGSQSNRIFKYFCEKIFVSGPKIDFPQYMLLNLPGMLITETLLYLWMNFYFLGMFRFQTDTALQMTEEENQYTHTLMKTQYKQLGHIKYHEIIIGCLIIFIAVLPTVVNFTSCHLNHSEYNHMDVFATGSISVLMLFLMPKDLSFIKFFSKHYGTEENPLPSSSSESCLNWNTINNGLHWSVLLILVSSSSLFEALNETGMTEEFEKFLLLFRNWPASAQVLVVTIFSKIFTEFAPNTCVVYSLLPAVARMSIISRVHPYCLMLACTLASSLPFHLVTGSPCNAMVAAYMNLSHWDMMFAGIGPSIISVIVTWFTVTIWSKAIWTTITKYPDWANNNTLTH